MPSSRASDAQARQPAPPVGDGMLPEETHAGSGAPAGGDAGRVAELEAEVARLDDRYKRALADLENYRKRSAQEVERRVAEREERLLRDWLEVVDSVDRAVLMHQGSPVEAGLQAVLSQMHGVLARHGVERLAPEGQAFDPNEHEAIGFQPSAKVAPHVVIAVPRAGYRLGDRVLRPAQVVVSRRPEEDT